MSFLTKNVFIAIAVFLLVTALSLKQPALAFENNTLVIEGQDFAAGSFEETAIDDRGRIVLVTKKGKTASSGWYTSRVIESHPFTELVMSWNADTPRGTAVSVEAQVQVDGSWSPWLSWGLWNTWGQSGSSKMDTKNAIAKMDIDTLIINQGKFATALRCRVNLNSSQDHVTPTVNLLAAAVNGLKINSSRNIEKRDIVLDVPEYAQRGRDPRIAGKICSPISITMLLNYYGVLVMPEETAWNVMDNSQDSFRFGNWPFNCAYAATFGLKSYVAYYNSLEDIRRDITAGRPVAASVIYKNSEEVPDNLPVLHNAPVEATEGHLVVVRGMVQKDGKEYVVVNDSAAREAKAVKRLYLAEEFEKAWTKLVYVVKKDNHHVSQPKHIPAKIIAGKNKHTLSLESAGGHIQLKAKDIGSILKLRSNQSVEFLQPEMTGDMLEQQAKGSLVIIITKHRQVFTINMN